MNVKTRRNIFLYYICCCILTLAMSCKEKQKISLGPIPSIKDSTAAQSITDPIDMSFLKKDGDHIIVPWKYLMGVSFEQSYNKKMAMEVSLPVFNDTLKMLDGKDVMIEGFYIPVDETGDDKIVIVSAFPFSQCFFCGRAGVESIVDVLSPKKLPTLKVDTKIKFKGRLKLNRDNFDYLIYVLEEAIMVE